MRAVIDLDQVAERPQCASALYVEPTHKSARVVWMSRDVPNQRIFDVWYVTPQTNNAEIIDFFCTPTRKIRVGVQEVMIIPSQFIRALTAAM
ncbi:MAG: hypothetical protein HY922_04640 [Elusimicrobia bacterium]|nr:hypothetical protein [Elusimicrobiota bacterium]